jgi:GNAT superfamily N-acetyltransferase
MAHVTVRAARTADIEALVDFNAEMALETESKVLDRAVVQAGVHAVFAEPCRGFYLVAEVDAAVAGCLLITYEWSDWRNGDWWWLQSVYVAQAHRRHGVFRALYAEVERRAGAREDVVGVRLYVERDNTHAQRTYTALGFAEDGYRMYTKPMRRDVRAALKSSLS